MVTCFNYGHFVREAIDTLLLQAGGPPQVVVVDDGSTDEATLETLEALPPSVEVVHQQNQGVGHARNNGLARATTDYVMVLDADDRLANGSLAALRTPLEADSQLGFAYGHQRFFGEWEGEMRLPPYDAYRLLYRHLIGPTALTRRQVVIDTGGYDPAFSLYEDWEFWVNALAHGWRGVRVDVVTLEYRRYDSAGKLRRDRRRYREMYRQLRVKHADLYRRDAELADSSDLGAAGRFVYRAFWGLRPVPASVEVALHRMLWSKRSPLARTP